MTVDKEVVTYPMGDYKSVRLVARDMKSFEEADKVLRDEYSRYRDMYSEADRNRLDKILGYKE